MHSVGSIPHGAEIDVPLNYADYYFLEALKRKEIWKNEKSIEYIVRWFSLFALQGCKTPQAEQAQQPNVIYVFPDQFRNQAMEFWVQEGFREKVNFRNDPVHTPRLNDFARESWY